MRENPDGFPCAQAAMRMGLTDCIARALSAGAAPIPEYGFDLFQKFVDLATLGNK
jgi:hypothetical protein